jgi:DNA-binding response OmpR family regulator
MERILVIEDDPKVQKAMTRLFEPEGFGVDIAADGPAGIEMFSAREPRIVLLDLRMPGMNGRNVCQEIKRRSPGFDMMFVL